MPSLRFIYFSILLTVLGGCSDAPLDFELPSSLILERYATSGDLISRQTVKESDEIYQRLNAVVRVGRSEWKKSVVSYTPAPFVFRADNLTISCYRNRIILDIGTQRRSHSYSREIPDLLNRLRLRE